jgi:nitronate monooxygenase
MSAKKRKPSTALERAKLFADEFNLQIPILLAPMPNATPPELAAAISNGGGMGACGALFMGAEEIQTWVHSMRSKSNGVFQLNTWIPDPDPIRDTGSEKKVSQFLEKWGPPIPAGAAETPLVNFKEQCDAFLEAGPRVVSSIMGLYPKDFVASLKEKNIKWFAKATTVSEAVLAEEAGADVIVAQGMEAGGHKGAFNAGEAETNMIGLFSLVPAISDAVNLPVVASGGVADARGIAAALLLGASAVEIGTGFLRCPEAGIAGVWADAIGRSKPEDTIVTRAFSGRLGRSIRTKYAVASVSDNAPNPAPYPIQRNLTKVMRDNASQKNDLDGMQAWAGQSSKLAQAIPASELVVKLWQETNKILK